MNALLEGETVDREELEELLADVEPEPNTSAEVGQVVPLPEKRS